MKQVLRPLIDTATRVVFFLSVWPLLWLCEPFVKVRIWFIGCDRMPLVSDPEIVARRFRRFGRPKRTWLLFFAADPCNRQILEMHKRQLPIIENRLLFRLYFAVRDWLENSRFWYPGAHPANLHSGELDLLGDTTLAFTAAEQERARLELAKMGIGPNDWFVCFHARSSDYLQSRYPGRDFSRNAIRDCSIETYLPAMRWVAAQGGFAIRMGAVVDAPLAVTEPRIVDYATHHRSDFMDAYLGTQCRYFVGCTAGIVSFAMVFNRPVGMANFVPPYEPGSQDGNLMLPKLYRDRDSGELLSFPRMQEIDLFDFWPLTEAEALFQRLGIEAVDSSPEDILELTRDLATQAAGLAPDPVTRQLQQAYRDRFHTWRKGYLRWQLVQPPLVDNAGWIAPSFIRKYVHLFEDPALTALVAGTP